VYEHIEYTPYGELWVERTASDLAKTPFRFTGKELDEETGLYYYGARYLNPQTSMWLSADPAMGEYIPRAPVDDDAKKYNQNLPGMGGVFNYVNLHTYHYAGNNPVKLVDPTGMWIDNGDGTHTAEQDDTLWGLYGADWQEKSGYTGDPRNLQIGQQVGKIQSPNNSSEVSANNGEKSEIFSSHSMFGNLYAVGVEPMEIGLASARVTAYATIDKKKNTVEVWALSTSAVYENGDVSSITEASLRVNGFRFDSTSLKETGTNLHSADSVYLGSAELRLPLNYQDLDLAVMFSTTYSVKMPAMFGVIGTQNTKVNLRKK
jgi:RHS repeat-associated protein